MCIICYKPAGQIVPEETIRAMLTRNPDGAGYVYYDKKAKRLILSKGYLVVEPAVKAIMAIPKNAPAIIHCRIKTHGKHAIGQTHPFPLVADKKLLEAEDLKISNGGYAVAHNGIFTGVSLGEDFSDTEAFIYKILAPFANAIKGSGIRLTDDSLKDTIDMLVGTSRIAIMDSLNGDVGLYGNGWVWDEGLAFSNTTYKPAPVYSNSWKSSYTKHNVRLCKLDGIVDIMDYDYKAKKYFPSTLNATRGYYATTYYVDSDGAIYRSWSIDDDNEVYKSAYQYILKGDVGKYYNERLAETKYYKTYDLKGV